jgi:hypothetical protein
MARNRQSPRLFESDLLERLSHVHPLTPLLVWGPVVAWLLWRSAALGVGTLVPLAAAGLVIWTLIEYLVHRFVFHHRPRSAAGRRLVFIMHGVHHEAPDDPTRLLMPPAAALIGLAAVYGALRVLLGSLWVEPCFAFFLIGYLVYDYTHLALHRCPRTRLGRALRRWHMLHHFATPEARWGVSSPLWDRVFRTGGRPGRAACLVAAVWLLATALVAGGHSSAGAAADWTVLSHKDGLLIERRAQENSSLYEIRATTQSSLSPGAIFDTIWKQQEHPQFIPHLKRLDLLSEAGDERLTYEQVEVPLARDRDYTVRLHKRVDPEAHRYEIVFTTANDAGPPPDRNHVRVPSIRGRWLIEPGPDGKGSALRYEVLSEAGGSLPTWVVNQVQGDAVAKLVRAILQRTREKASRR